MYTGLYLYLGSALILHVTYHCTDVGKIVGTLPLKKENPTMVTEIT